MPDYSGKTCLICNKTFKPGDDIVVCPECGTPYHRECYQKVGKCVNESLHISGKSWRSQNSNSNEEKKLICPNCHAENSQHNLFCERCGFPLSSKNDNPYNFNHNQNSQSPNMQGGYFTFPGGVAFNPSDRYFGLNPDEDFEGVKLSEIADYVGSNTLYYLPMFKRMKDTGRKMSFSLLAFFFPQYYYANRKMYLSAIIALIIGMIIEIPQFFYTLTQYPDIFGSLVTNINININSDLFQTLLTASSVANWIFILLTGTMSNWFYYRHVIKSIKAIKSKEITGGTSAERIKESGGTSLAGILTMFFIEFVVYLVCIIILNH